MYEYTLETTALAATSRKLAKAGTTILASYLVDTNMVADIELALTEACANVANHAYKNEPGIVGLHLCVDREASCVIVEVLDQGEGFSLSQCTIAPPDSENGRGLYIIASLAQAVTSRVEHGFHIVSFTINIQDTQWKI